MRGHIAPKRADGSGGECSMRPADRVRPDGTSEDDWAGEAVRLKHSPDPGMAGSASPALAQAAASKQQMQSLDEQGFGDQSPTSTIATAELNRLEAALGIQALGSPVFVCFGPRAQTFQLDSVRQIDGRPLLATILQLPGAGGSQKGGCNGSTPSPRHKISFPARNAGSTSDARGSRPAAETSRGRALQLHAPGDVGPKLVGVKLGSADADAPAIQLGGWWLQWPRASARRSTRPGGAPARRLRCWRGSEGPVLRRGALLPTGEQWFDALARLDAR